MNRKLFLFCLLLALAACQAATPAAPTPTFTAAPSLTPVPSDTPIPSSTPTPLPPSPTPFPNPFEGKTKVGNYDMTISCKGSGEPTIILDNGLENISWISNHLTSFSTISRTCRYPRVGTTDKTANPPGPRTGMDTTNELHALLHQTGVPGPYILVGHSIAVIDLLLYTSLYPDEVVGLVCVDCTTIDFPFLEKIAPELTADPSLAATLGIDPKYTQVPPDPEAWKQNSEHIDIEASISQITSVTSLGERPFIVLVATNHPYDPDPRVVKAWQAAWEAGEASLSKLSTQGRLELVPGTDHTTILFSAAVAKAIQEVYDRVKKQ